MWRDGLRRGRRRARTETKPIIWAIVSLRRQTCVRVACAVRRCMYTKCVCVLYRFGRVYALCDEICIAPCTPRMGNNVKGPPRRCIKHITVFRLIVIAYSKWAMRVSVSVCYYIGGILIILACLRMNVIKSHFCSIQSMASHISNIMFTINGGHLYQCHRLRLRPTVIRVQVLCSPAAVATVHQAEKSMLLHCSI